MSLQGWGIWITGLPASGKTTITHQLVAELKERKINVQVLESDTLRQVFTPKPTYSPEERETFYNSMIYLGNLLSQNGINVIFDAVANRRRWREKARKVIPRFLEIYVNTPLAICRQRDPKDIYKLADRGDAQYVPGQQQTYEEPLSPDLVLDGQVNPDHSVQKIIEVMKRNGFI